MSITAASCPFAGFEPSRLGKLRVVWRMDSASFAGTSPAPKHGPQKHGLKSAPASKSRCCTPLWMSSRLTGMDGG